MRTIRNTPILLLGSVVAYAQVGTGGGSATSNTNPAQIIWAVVAILGGMGSAWVAASLIWTAMQGAVSDHEQFHKLPRIAFWAAILFSATYISGRFALGI